MRVSWPGMSSDLSSGDPAFTGTIPQPFHPLSRAVSRAKEAVLLGTAIGMPLVFYGRHEDEPFNITKLSLLLAGVSCASALTLLQMGLGHRFSGVRRVAVPALALTLPLLLSWLFSPYRGWALFGQFSRFNGLLPYAAFALLGVLLVTSFRGRPQKLATGMAVAGALVGAYAFVQAVGLDPLWKPGTDAGTPFPPSSVGHYNFAGGVLAICLPFSVLVWFLHKPAWLGMATTVTTVLGLIMTNSQGGWIAAIAGVMIIGGALAARRRPIVTILTRTVVVGIVIAIVAGVVISAGATRPPLGGTAGSRGLLWKTAVEMGAASPVVGRGPGAYAVEGVRYRNLDYVLLEKNTKADDPHSVPLSFWANAGLFGAIGFILFASWIVKRGLAVAKHDVVGAAFFAGCVSYLVQSLVSIDEPSLRAGLWVCVAGLASSGMDDRITRIPSPSPSRARIVTALVVASVVAAVGIWYALGLMGAHRDVVKAKELFATEQLTPAQETFERAIGFRFEPRYLSAYAFALGRAGLDARERGGPLIERMAEVDAYLDDFPEATALLTSARIYFYRGHFDPSSLHRAEAILLRTEPLDPANPEIEISLAEVYLAGGDAPGALAILAPLERELTGDLPSFWATLAVAHAMNGDEEAGKAALEHAVAMNPNDCRVLIASGLYERMGSLRLSKLVSSNLGFNCPAGDSRYLQDRIEELRL